MQTIGLINLFEKITRAGVKDCFIMESTLIFVVNQGDIGKAVGKGGSNIQKLTRIMKKQVKIIQFDSNPSKFTLNLLFPLKPAEIKQDDDKIIIKAKDISEKGKIFGREKTNLKRMQEIISKYFPVKLMVE
ncbi:MAG: NusA-like transcription termination signal-binding factor [Nanoarchaeota archaeon]|nr:NusA-like transcription termination signal-binding factor [Nanoarchaeota archaeon]MBU4352334.1 NusA-like transcription termination signal-binding factor [Nanoarchaeota archaeon]